MVEQTYGVGELVSAWLEARRYRRGIGRADGYEERRYAALSGAFDVDLDSVPALTPELERRMEEALERLLEGSSLRVRGRISSTDVAALHKLLLRTADQYAEASSPFSVYLEAPLGVIAVYRRHNEQIVAASEELRARLHELLVAIARLLWPQATEATVGAAELRAGGFDPAERPPERDDF